MHFSKGFTLIELFTYILLTTAVSYVVYLSYKPNSHLEQLDLKVNNLQQLSLALQSYQSVYGNWPDESASSKCSKALEVLKTAGDGNFIHDVKPPYGGEFEFSCETDILASPLMVTFDIPQGKLDYFSRYLYKLEISYIDSMNPEALMSVSMTVPSTHQNVKHFIVPAKFGGTFHVESDNILNISEDVEVEDHSAMVRIPESCNQELPIDVDFFSNGLCTHRDDTFYVDNKYAEMGIRIKITLKERIEYVDVHVSFIKERYIEELTYDYEYCKFGVVSFKCSEDKKSNLVSWKVTPKPEVRTIMGANYYYEDWFGEFEFKSYNFSELNGGKDIETKFLSDKVLNSIYEKFISEKSFGTIERIDYEFNYHYDDLFKEQTNDYFFSTCEAENRAAGYINSIANGSYNYDATIYAVVACQVK